MPTNRIFPEYRPSDEEQWLPVSDVMAGLMVIFLFLAIVFIKDTIRENERIQSIAVAWEDTQERLYRRLHEEFHEDLTDWHAELDRATLSIRFMEPSVFFDQGETAVKPRFRRILADFFPRYLKILHGEFRDSVEEIRIEGHTSSEWDTSSSADEAYFRNMELSQDRTRAVLEYCLLLPHIEGRRIWTRAKLTANGLSSSQLVVVDGVEQQGQSRRVEFRVRTNADDQIRRILAGSI